MGQRLFGIGGDDDIEGEDIGVRRGVEGFPGKGETAAFGVEESEVVGNVGKVWDERLDV